MEPKEMTPWLSVEEGKALGGLRLVLTAGVPGPWGESAKACFNTLPSKPFRPSSIHRA